MTTPLLPLAASGPSLDWYLTRSTGAVALLLLSVAVALGVADVRRFSTPSWPRFVVDALHRNVSLLALVFLVLHILTAVLDSFTSISLVAAFVPFAGSYRPFWLGLGAVAFDLLLAVILTSMLRGRVGPRAWRATHWLVYACWPVALLHTLGTGSDVKTTWLLALSRLLPGTRARCRARPGAPRLVSRQRARARPCRRRRVRVRARPRAVAALRAARLGMGAALRHPLNVAGPRLRLQLEDRGQPVSTYEQTFQSSPAVTSADAPGLPRLLAGIPSRGALPLREHLALHGELPAVGRPWNPAHPPPRRRLRPDRGGRARRPAGPRRGRVPDGRQAARRGRGVALSTGRGASDRGRQRRRGRARLRQGPHSAALPPASRDRRRPARRHRRRRAGGPARRL